MPRWDVTGTEEAPIAAVSGPLRLGTRTFAEREPVVMAILNRTPDSFYDRGATWAFGDALERVAEAVGEGAEIVDIGGVRAGEGPPVDEVEEVRRTAPLVAAVRARHQDLVISVDTCRAGVARVLCEQGADLVNDTWAGYDPALAEVAAAAGAGLVCSHTGGLPPRSTPRPVAYDDVVADVVRGTTRLAERAVALGVRPDGVLIDPTHDFGKDTRQSLELVRRLGEVVATGWPVLVALSRKDFVGETLDLPVDERLPGTLAVTALAAWHGARVFRAHDVRETRQVVELVAAVKGQRPPAAACRGLP